MSNEEVAPETKGVTAELLTTVDLGSEIEGMAGRPSGPSALTARKPAAQPRAPHGRRHPNTQSRDRRTHLLRAQGGRRKDQEGSTAFTQTPDLQRRLSAAAPRRPIGGPGGHSGTTPCLRDRLFTLRDRLFGEVTPEPKQTLRRCTFGDGSLCLRLKSRIWVLTQRGFVRGRFVIGSFTRPPRRGGAAGRGEGGLNLWSLCRAAEVGRDSRVQIQ